MSENEKKHTLICQSCGVPMEEAEVDFEYLNYSFSAAIPRCPKCGMICVPEDVARGKMKDAETMLEDK